MFRAATRGRFRTLLTRDGGPVATRLFGCAVQSVTPGGGGAGGGSKSYAHLRLAVADAALDAADREIRRLQPDLRFSPLGGGGRSLCVKVPADARYEGVDGDPTPPWPLAAGMLVDVEVRLGAFGSFGYCWLLARVKPAAAPASQSSTDARPASRA